MGTKRKISRITTDCEDTKINAIFDVITDDIWGIVFEYLDPLEDRWSVVITCKKLRGLVVRFMDPNAGNNEALRWAMENDNVNMILYFLCF